MYEYSEECTRCAQKVYAVGASTVVRVLVILIYQYSLYTLYRLVQLCSVPDVHKKVCTKSVPYIPHIRIIIVERWFIPASVLVRTGT